MRELQKIKEITQRKAHYFKKQKTTMLEFKFIEKDIKQISQMGQLVENTTIEEPLILFNKK